MSPRFSAISFAPDDWKEFTDVNGDGRADMLLFFDAASLKLTPATRTATLSGWLNNSQAFTGETTTTVLP